MTNIDGVPCYRCGTLVTDFEPFGGMCQDCYYERSAEEKEVDLACEMGEEGI